MMKTLREIFKKIDMDTSPCIQCGYCCQTSPCPFGEWDEVHHQCKFLSGSRPGEYVCDKYEEIIALGDAGKYAPAFGAGCCSTMFNEQRITAFCNRTEKKK